jgi:CubicO group peptidase (beta-lactamase class C family)
MRGRAGILVFVVAILLGAASATPALGGQSSCGKGKIRTATGCTKFAAAGRAVRQIVGQEFAGNGLRAVIGRIDVGDRTLARFSPGESMAGVPANLRMHFRIGSVAIPYLMDLLFQLQDEKRLSLNDPVSKWFPELPNSNQVTLRMLASATSGYADWIQGNPAFQQALLADPFRQWTQQELLAIALSRPLICNPGACFHYAHTGFVILGNVIEKLTGKPVAQLLRRRVLRPLGLHETAISSFPAMPEPALHAYVDLRGPYEDSTYWSASWGISHALTMTSTIGDVIKSAKALVTKALVSRSAARQRVAPITANLHPFSQSLYYGLGIDVANGWQVQNPVLNGWSSIMAALPSRRIALALSVTLGPSAVDSPTNFAERLLLQLTQYLTPNRVAKLPDA